MEDGLEPRAVDCPGRSGSARHGKKRHGWQQASARMAGKRGGGEAGWQGRRERGRLLHISHVYCTCTESQMTGFGVVWLSRAIALGHGCKLTMELGTEAERRCRFRNDMHACGCARCSESHALFVLFARQTGETGRRRDMASLAAHPPPCARGRW